MKLETVKEKTPSSSSVLLSQMNYSFKGETVQVAVYITAAGIMQMFETWPDGTVLVFSEKL